MVFYLIMVVFCFFFLLALAEAYEGRTAKLWECAVFAILALAWPFVLGCILGGYLGEKSK
jgi:hypothetical protein